MNCAREQPGRTSCGSLLQCAWGFKLSSCCKSTEEINNDTIEEGWVGTGKRTEGERGAGKGRGGETEEGDGEEKNGEGTKDRMGMWRGGATKGETGRGEGGRKREGGQAGEEWGE